MKNKTKIPFDPNNFDTSITVKELTNKFRAPLKISQYS